MIRTKKYSRLPDAFKHALAGIRDFATREQHARIYAGATIGVIILAFGFKVSIAEWIAIILVSGFVWVAEMLNTCIEKILDLISEERSADIRFIKDVAAGAVLLASLTALVTGLLLFIPKMI
jgi:diacylglycerol kinase (ATP)